MPILPNQTYGKGTPENTDVMLLFKPEVYNWLHEKTRLLITDYFTIKNSYQHYGVSGLSDYSFLITPAFKALEGTLIQIGNELGFDLKNAEHRIGVVFNEENLSKYYQDVLSKIESLDAENKEDISMWLNDARRLLRHFRHSPAHYNGETKDSWVIAFSTGDHILRIIHEMCLTLYKSKLIKFR